jgi:hypothetical protein
MNKKSLLAGAILILCLAGILVSRGCRDAEVSSTAITKQPSKSAPVLPSPTAGAPPQIPAALEAKMNLLYLTPIAFYGRVVDQNGVPVEGAKIEFSANTVPFGDGEKFGTISDGAGNFQVTGKHGRSLFVGVSKNGYYRLPETTGKPGSSGAFAYGSDLGYGVHSPSKASPVIFVLRKAGPVEPLVARHEIKVPLVPDGTVYPVSLRQSRGTDHRILLSCHSEAMPESGGAFDWSFDVKVEDGELADRTDDFAFEAPTSGYRAEDSVAMSRGLPPEKWKDRVSKSYFIRFNDGTAARATVDFHAGAKPHVWLDSYLNPKPGSRNLEAGPPRLSGK